MRVAIVGARSHRSLAQVWRRVRELPADATVVSGGADGVDTVAALAARQRWLGIEEHLPGAGGPLARNTTIAMSADELDAFPWPDCRGTWDTVRKAQSRGIPVRVHEPEVDRQALLVFSARRSYAGPGALCIMRHGGEGDGLAFAPTERLLERVLAARGEATKLREAAAALRGRQMRLGEGADEVAARELRAKDLEEQAARVEAENWAAYASAFRSEMRVSYGLTRDSVAWARRSPEERALLEQAWERGARPRPDAWRRLLAKGFCVIMCGCPSDAACHRGILRAEILPALGAVDGGEVPTR